MKMTSVSPAIEIIEATPDDAQVIADIHITARLTAMPYLVSPHSDDQTRDWLASCVGDQPSSWWLARKDGRVVGYMFINGDQLDHLYVHPDAQGCGIGTCLLQEARMLSPERIVLATFQSNARARAFYEKHDFRPVRFTDGENEEAEPDVYYLWEASR